MSDTEALQQTGVDQLTTKSREFYESTRFKMMLSMIYAAFSMLCLGLTANSKYNITKLFIINTQVKSHSY